MNILIVDDELELLGLIKELVEYNVQGSVVDTASTCEEALKMLESKGYDKVLCDYQLAGNRSGTDVLTLAICKGYVDHDNCALMSGALEIASSTVPVFGKPFDLKLLVPFLKK
jgi:CheY-like chemotaxis protein